MKANDPDFLGTLTAEWEELLALEEEKFTAANHCRQEGGGEDKGEEARDWWQIAQAALHMMITMKGQHGIDLAPYPFALLHHFLLISDDMSNGNLQSLRDDDCADPDTVPDDEIRKIADWAWSRRLEGKVYRGRDSDFRLHRSALDALRQLPNASDAIALFVTLQDQHGHTSKPFPLDFPAMKAAGHTDLSRERFIAARDALRSAGLLEIATRHLAGKQPRAYRLTRLRPHAANVTRLHGALTTGGGV